jgi:hypothetical protein
MAGQNKQLEGSDKTALITGASSGIGRAFAGVFAEKGFDLILVSRRRDRLEVLAKALSSQWGITARAFPADLSDPETPRRIYEKLSVEHIKIDALINNAGYAITTPFSEAPWNIHADFLHVLLTSVTRLCHLFLPGMKENGYGRIINVGSILAFMTGINGDLYYGAKSFLLRFSQALAAELYGTGVHVTALCPGFTKTELHQVTGIQEEVKRLPGFMWMDADAVARQGYDAVMKGKSVYINGLINRFIVAMMIIIPDPMQYAMARLVNRKLKRTMTGA